jgi:hypothetical protein
MGMPALSSLATRMITNFKLTMDKLKKKSNAQILLKSI